MCGLAWEGRSSDAVSNTDRARLSSNPKVTRMITGSIEAEAGMKAGEFYGLTLMGAEALLRNPGGAMIEEETYTLTGRKFLGLTIKDFIIDEERIMITSVRGYG